MTESILENLIKKPFISPKEFCFLFGLSKETVYRLIHKGIIPVYKIGGSLRFAREDILKYISKKRIG